MSMSKRCHAEGIFDSALCSLQVLSRPSRVIAPDMPKHDRLEEFMSICHVICLVNHTFPVRPGPPNTEEKGQIGYNS